MNRFLFNLAVYGTCAIFGWFLADFLRVMGWLP
jgi:hypothetical protein